MADQQGDEQPETITITVKSVEISIWERARKAAKAQGQPMGEWLGRAINQLADREAGERIEFPPVVAAPPPGMTEVKPMGMLAPVVNFTALEGMMRAAQAIGEASGVKVPPTTAKHAYALMNTALRDARGMPPLAPPKPRGAANAARVQVQPAVLLDHAAE